MRGIATALCVLSLLASTAWADSGPEFKGYEVRVIRPRYFVKNDRFELGTGLSAVMNQSFIYSYLATGLLTWHASETVAIEAQGSYGRSFDREEKRKLQDDFNINTVILRTESLASGRLVWTPSYGKYHLTDSDVVYFDTFVTAGAGLTGVRYHYDHCDDPNVSKPAESVRQYPTLILGIGQRHFVSEKSALRVSAELQRILVNTADGQCHSGAPRDIQPRDNVILFLGWSKFL